MPLAHPAAGSILRTRRGKQFVTGRQVQRGRYTVKSCMPARHRHRLAGVGAAQRLDIDVQTAHLDSGLTLLVTFGYQEILACLCRAQERERRRHVQAPAGIHRAADRIADDKPVTIEIQPHSPDQTQPVIGRHDAAAAFIQRKRFPGANTKSRQLLPPIGYLHLRRIHGR